MTANLVDTLLQAGFGELSARLREIKPKDRAQALILEVVVDAVAQYGLEGASAVADDVMALLDGNGKDVDLDLTDLRLSSDLLAAIQVMDAEGKNAARDLTAKVVDSIAPIVVGLLGALARSA